MPTGKGTEAMAEWRTTQCSPTLFRRGEYSPLQCSHQVSPQPLWTPEKTAATWCPQCRCQAHNCNVTGCFNLWIRLLLRDAEGNCKCAMQRACFWIQRTGCGGTCAIFAATLSWLVQPRPSSGCKWTRPDPGDPRNFGGVASHTCLKGRAQAPCAEHCIQTG